MWSEAVQAIKDSSMESSIYIGCDSIRIPDKNIAKFSTVIILHMDSRHGCKVFHNREVLPDYGHLPTRLMNEVGLAIDAFYAIEDYVEDRPLELHIDVNPDPKYASNCVTRQALGWVRGLGINAKIKPHSFAASTAADHCVRR